jgi:CBS domain-containing protein
MATVAQLIEQKDGGDNISVSAGDSVLKALQIMAETNISAVMVTEGGKIIGIFTERDYTRKGELKGRAAADTSVRSLMTGEMMTVSPESSIEQCMQLMRQYRIRHLPVVAGGAMVGMVSMRDVVEVLLHEKESEIVGLENYVLGSGFAA